MFVPFCVWLVEAWFLLTGVVLTLLLPPRLVLPFKTTRGVTLADALVTVAPPHSSGDTVAVSLGVTFGVAGFTVLVIFGVTFLATIGVVDRGSCKDQFLKEME